jgi:hypothetical protein
MTAHVVSTEDVERTISVFARVDQRGDKKAMTRLVQRLQREQPFLLQRAAAVKAEHGDAAGEAAMFYATLLWAMFDRGRNGTLPRLTEQNFADADKVVTEVLSTMEAPPDKPAYEHAPPALVSTQPHIYAKLGTLLADDITATAMTAATASLIMKPIQVVIEAFDAALSGRRPGERQGTIAADPKVGRNDPCPCGSGKKYKKCHGEVA